MSKTLICPYCGAEAGSCVDDIDQYADRILRTRVCLGCHMPFRTTEIIDKHEKEATE